MKAVKPILPLGHIRLKRAHNCKKTVIIYALYRCISLLLRNVSVTGMQFNSTQCIYMRTNKDELAMSGFELVTWRAILPD